MTKGYKRNYTNLNYKKVQTKDHSTGRKNNEAMNLTSQIPNLYQNKMTLLQRYERKQIQM